MEQYFHAATEETPENLVEAFDKLESDARKDSGTMAAYRFQERTILHDSPWTGFVRSFEKLTGKRVVFVDTAKDVKIPFAGAVIPGRPNTIFVHIRGGRHIMPLIGHEWGHTLAEQDAPLYRSLQLEVAKYLTKPQARAYRDKVRARGYDVGKLSTEMTAPHPIPGPTGL